MAEDKKLNPEELENVAGGYLIYHNEECELYGLPCPKCGSDGPVYFKGHNYRCGKCGHTWNG